MEKSNIERLQDVVEGLDNLNEKVTYVGGSVSQLYATDSAATEPRATMDVDCVVNYLSFQEKIKFEELLRKKHFEEDMEEGAPICRWKYNGDLIDIMPTEEKYLGFTNIWYKPGIEEKIKYTLPNGRTILIMPVLYYLATKIEAIHSRGGNDLRTSHDFEDLIYVLNYCKDIVKTFKKETNNSLKSYLKEESKKFLQRQNINEEIECALPIEECDRVDEIIEILETFSNN